MCDTQKIVTTEPQLSATRFTRPKIGHKKSFRARMVFFNITLNGWFIVFHYFFLCSILYSIHTFFLSLNSTIFKIPFGFSWMAKTQWTMNIFTHNDIAWIYVSFQLTQERKKTNTFTYRIVVFGRGFCHSLEIFWGQSNGIHKMN